MDITDDFKVAMYERMATPLFAALVISWSLWNYDILLHLFAGYGSVTRKIEAIEGLTKDWCKVYGWPLLTTGLTVVIYPWLSAAVFWIGCHAKKWKEEQRVKVEEETSKSGKEYFKLEEKFNQEKRKLQEEFAASEDRETRQKNVNAQLRQQQDLRNKEHEEALKAKSGEVKELQKKLDQAQGDLESAKEKSESGKELQRAYDDLAKFVKSDICTGITQYREPKEALKNKYDAVNKEYHALTAENEKLKNRIEVLNRNDPGESLDIKHIERQISEQEPRLFALGHIVTVYRDMLKQAKILINN